MYIHVYVLYMCTVHVLVLCTHDVCHVVMWFFVYQWYAYMCTVSLICYCKFCSVIVLSCYRVVIGGLLSKN